MSEKWSGPRVVPDMTAMDRHPIGWWVCIIGAGILGWLGLVALGMWIIR